MLLRNIWAYSTITCWLLYKERQDLNLAYYSFSIFSTKDLINAIYVSFFSSHQSSHLCTLKVHKMRPEVIPGLSLLDFHPCSFVIHCMAGPWICIFGDSMSIKVVKWDILALHHRLCSLCCDSLSHTKCPFCTFATSVLCKCAGQETRWLHWESSRSLAQRSLHDLSELLGTAKHISICITLTWCYLK